MLNKKLRQQKQEGFTIIEVLIVLAIAALILLIVFLAVPALQRASRNNARKNDASRIATEVANFASNNNGVLPGFVTASGTVTGAQFTTDCATIGNQVGNLSDLGNTSGGPLKCNTALSNTPTDNEVTEASSYNAAVTYTSATGSPWSNDWVIVQLGVSCGNFGTSTTTVVGNNRQSVVLYPQETGGGSSAVWDIACIQAT